MRDDSHDGWIILLFLIGMVLGLQQCQHGSETGWADSPCYASSGHEAYEVPCS